MNTRTITAAAAATVALYGAVAVTAGQSPAPYEPLADGAFLPFGGVTATEDPPTPDVIIGIIPPPPTPTPHLATPTPAPTPVPTRRATPAPTSTPGDVAFSGKVAGVATWYAYVPGGAAAGPALRKAIGPNWRGSSVKVCAGSRCVRVTLSDWCACGPRPGGPTVIDLDVRSFAALAATGIGVLEVTVYYRR